MSAASRIPDRERVPGRHWTSISVEQARLSADKLETFSSLVGGTGCVVQGGQLVYEWGDTSFQNDIASAIKPMYGYLTLKAIETGLLESLDDRVVKWVPEIANLNESLGFKDREITFRHLLEQTSGYGLQEKPGEAFAYNDTGTALLVWTLLHRVYGVAGGQEDDLLNGELLGRAIGFEDQPTSLHPLSPEGRIRISARDYARFGLLMLRGGRWGGTQVLPEDLFEVAMTGPRRPPLPRTSGAESRHWNEIEPIGGGKDENASLGCLGYFWWFNKELPDGTRLLPAAPPDTFMAMGYAGQFMMIIIPELDWVVVGFDIWEHNARPFDTVGRFWVNTVLTELLQARTLPDS